MARQVLMGTLVLEEHRSGDRLSRRAMGEATGVALVEPDGVPTLQEEGRRRTEGELVPSRRRRAVSRLRSVLVQTGGTEIMSCRRVAYGEARAVWVGAFRRNVGSGWDRSR